MYDDFNLDRIRPAVIVSNWKMNLGPTEAKNFLKEHLPELSKILYSSNTDVIRCILCPPTISLAAVREVLDALPTSLQEYIGLGAQNMHFENKGAFTGEVSPSMVRELCGSVILGHSERRQYFGETNYMVNKKVQAALAAGLQPIVCVGENQEQHDAGDETIFRVIEEQVSGCLRNLSIDQLPNIMVAYEPLWAIGTGRAATVDDASKAITYVRALLIEMYEPFASDSVNLLYGGSVTSENICDFIAYPDIDGALVGGASIKSDFVDMVRNVVAYDKEHHKVISVYDENGNDMGRDQKY